MKKLQPIFQGIWGIFGNFCKFLCKKHGFSPCAPRHVARAYDWRLQMQKSLYFWIFHEKS